MVGDLLVVVSSDSGWMSIDNSREGLLSKVGRRALWQMVDKWISSPKFKPNNLPNYPQELVLMARSGQAYGAHEFLW